MRKFTKLMIGQQYQLAIMVSFKFFVVDLHPAAKKFLLVLFAGPLK